MSLVLEASVRRGLLLLAALVWQPASSVRSAIKARAAPGPDTDWHGSGSLLEATAAVVASGADPVKKIEEKWDKMDEFVGIMFKIACKWKHGKDVNGLAAEKLKNKEISRDEVQAFKRETHAKNVKRLKMSCGFIVASSKGKCRQNCADGFGIAKQKRAECDKKCVDLYADFEKQCMIKAENLEKVYEGQQKSTAARKQCHEGNCPNIPTVWMKEKEADMVAEAEKQCKALCSDAKIKTSCDKKWLLEVDFLKAGISSKCFADGKVQSCFKGKKDKAGKEQETCAKTGKGKCKTQFDECKTKGETDKAEKDAKEFCVNRKKMCEQQVTDDCLAKHKAGLDTAKADCEKANEKEMDKCETDAIKKKEDENKKKCITEKKTTCPKDCKKECDAPAMAKCLNNLKSNNDMAQMFCDDMWRLLHESSEAPLA